MKKPTVEEIAGLIAHYYHSGFHENDVASAIHDLYNPTLKPLEELHKDEKACREIAEMFCVEFGRIVVASDSVVHIVGKFDNEKARVIIWPDGDVFFEIGGKDTPIANPFAIADKIRSLGYEPQ